MTPWLLTFAVHSTLWCGLAWLSLCFFPGIHARLRETIWYLALAASLITPTAHALISPNSAIWRLPVPSFIAGGEHGSEGEPGRGDGAVSVSLLGREEAHGEDDAASASWVASAGVLWLVLAGGLLALHFVRMGRLRGRLRDREPVTDPRAKGALSTLAGTASLNPPPRLTESHNLGSPVALGVGARREICVPVRALHELDEEELRALLGHEVAHHLRRDTIRLAILHVLQAVFFFQPLLRLAVRDVRLAAEELCDDWAASHAGDHFAMASCLTEVARWVVPRDRHSPVPCIGRRRSQLELRVRRLMTGNRSPRTPSGRWRHVSRAGLLILTPLLAPAVAPGADRSHEARRALAGAWPRAHGEAGEHELRDRRERSPGSGARSATSTTTQREDQ